MSDAALLAEAVKSCRRCELAAGCNGPVPFSGPAPASIAIVGEAPGKQEDEQGQPFIGPAGKLIRELLADVVIDASQAFICNTVSCFPASHKNPKPEHVKACRINKLAQLDLANPAWVLLLGSVALGSFAEGLNISKGRARPFKPVGQPYVCFATYHPSYALRQPLAKPEIAADLAAFKKMVDAGPDNWTSFVPDRCVHCTNFASWFGEDGIGVCRTHEPPEATERRDFNQSDYQAACSRLENR